MKLFDSELKIMDVLWKEGDLPAGIIAQKLKGITGWNRNTTYTIIKKCVEKGAIERYEPKFMCRAVVTQQEIQEEETEDLIDRFFAGSKQKFFASFLDAKKLTEEEIEELLEIVQKNKVR